MENPLFIYNTLSRKRNNSCRCTSLMSVCMCAVLLSTAIRTSDTLALPSLSTCCSATCATWDTGCATCETSPTWGTWSTTPTRERTKLRKSTLGAAGADGSGTILHKPLPQGYGSAQRAAAKHRASRFRTHS